MSQPMPALMQRRRNRVIFYGFIFILLTIAGAVPALYGLNFPGLVLLPWINVALPAIAVVFFIVGLKRAFGQPETYRGKVWGSILGLLSVLLFAGSVWGYHHAKDLPPSSGAPKVGQKAPDFSLSDTSGKATSLSELLSTPIDAASGKGPRAVLLVFYRGYW